ncbi:MAG: methyltransferase domain-containing protein [Chloroflexota bacterium]
MNISSKMTIAYFNLVYNRLYDSTTARLAPYQRWQGACLGKFRLDNGNKVLCAGVGTGNEIVSILGINSELDIVGVDSSDTALRRAHKKASAHGKEIELLTMDVQNLDFTSESFDKVLCLHVMDFIEDKRKTTVELLRVLTKGGQFVITYPSAKEGATLALNLLKESISHNTNAGKYGRMLSGLLTTMSGGLVYLPLMFRTGQKPCSRSELETIFHEVGVADFKIEDYPVYCDFIVYGKK